MNKKVYEMCEEIVSGKPIYRINCSGVNCFEDGCPFSFVLNNNTPCCHDTNENYIEIAKKYLAENKEI